MPNKTLRNKIESIMTGPGKAPAVSLAACLHWLSRGYGIFQKLRSACYRRRLIAPRKLACRVISIGNITIGGTGKTPLTIFVAERLRQLGYRVAVVSRGYKGTAGRTATIISDGQNVYLGPEQAGDEPYLLACRLRGIPVMVGSNRCAVGRMAMDRFQPAAIVLDDGFQHMQLARDLDLVLLDYHRPFGNQHLLPRGTLREPQSALKRSDAIVLTRCPVTPGRCPDAPGSLPHPFNQALEGASPQSPVFMTSHLPVLYRVPRDTRVLPDELDSRIIPDQHEIINQGPVAAFSGIARNDDFRQTLDTLGFNIAHFAQFADHHWYSDSELAAIEQAAGQSSAQCFVTTEKDFVRFAHRKTWPLEMIVFGVRVSFGEDEKRFEEFLKIRLGR
ncbi:MAG: tetraacyldisaccharide 4'-kinase [Deltaproteobacteria bacterium]|jgi:tetraacyldisaccharide 4'-kinase|nr:tetraacyldisaccharide 4'-kinase [Deltaproteobacteria bacterium]